MQVEDKKGCIKGVKAGVASSEKGHVVPWKIQTAAANKSGL